MTFLPPITRTDDIFSNFHISITYRIDNECSRLKLVDTKIISDLDFSLLAFQWLPTLRELY